MGLLEDEFGAHSSPMRNNQSIFEFVTGGKKIDRVEHTNGHERSSSARGFISNESMRNATSSRRRRYAC